MSLNYLTCTLKRNPRFLLRFGSFYYQVHRFTHLAKNRQNFDYFLILDFEATCDRGFSLRPQEIIEFPVLKMDAASFTIVSEFHSYVRPVVHPNLTTFCTSLTGIIQDMIENEPTFDKVLEQFHNWLVSEKLLGYDKTFSFITCGDWDLNLMLPSQCQLLDLPVPGYFDSWINIKKIFADVTKFYPQTLSQMLSRLRIPVKGHLHSGIDDCYNIAAIVQSLGSKGCCFQTTNHYKEEIDLS